MSSRRGRLMLLVVAATAAWAALVIGVMAPAAGEIAQLLGLE